MLSSKANAALTRLKEIEEKYRIKREQQRWKKDTDSSISSVSINPSENSSTELKESPRNISKAKLDIKLPDTRFEGHTVDPKFLTQEHDEISPRHLEHVDLDATTPTPLEDKLPRSAGKQESFASDITTVQENSSIESVLDDSQISSNSLSHSNRLQQQFSTSEDRSSKREDKMKVGAKSVKEETLAISRRKSLSDNSSVSRRSKLSTKSNGKTFKSSSKLKSRGRLMEEKEEDVTKKRQSPEAMNFGRSPKNSDRSKSSHDKSVIDESIGTVEDDSEIISEISRLEESIASKIEDTSANKTEHSISENLPVNISNNSRHSVAENGYANDTFEDISSSSMRSKSEFHSEKIIDEKEIVDRTESSTKKIKIILHEEHRSYQDSIKSHRDEQVVASKATSNVNEISLNKISSHYVEKFEGIDTNPDNVITRLSNSPRSISSRSEKRRKHYKHQMKSSKENVSIASSSDENILDSSVINAVEEMSFDDITKMNKRVPRRGSLKFGLETKVTSAMVEQHESVQEKRGKALGETRKRAMTNVIELPIQDDEKGSESLNRSEEEIEEGEENENISEESSDERDSQNIENTMSVVKKLHRDAINAVARRRASAEITEKTSRSYSGRKTKSKTKTHDTMTKMTRETMARKDEYFSSEDDKFLDYNNREHNIKKKKRTKFPNLKVTETSNNIGHKKEDETVKYDRKQIHRLQRRIVEMRLRQEREDFQKYLHELKDLRLESHSTRSYFSPLEFPKIAEFTQPDAVDLNSKPNNQLVALRERVSAIRQRLKDQYTLYRDYCAMAQAINAHYVPTTVEDAKKTIRELRETMIKIK